MNDRALVEVAVSNSADSTSVTLVAGGDPIWSHAALPGANVTLEFDGFRYFVEMDPWPPGTFEGKVDITSMMSNAPLTVDDLRATIEKCDQVESPAPADNLRHDPTKRVTKRRRR
jgi:hypothetical protein